MSPPAEFDLTTFCFAIERHDAAVQLCFYATDALVQLTCLRDPTRVTRTLKGVGVKHWIDERCADREVTSIVVSWWLSPGQLMLTEERCCPDQMPELSASIAHVSNGLIGTQSVVLISTPNPRQPEIGPA